MKAYRREKMTEIKNIILISIDDLRFDCISCEKDKRWLERYNAHSIINTPVLNRIAKRGVRFTQCISTSSYTPSSHASMLTGLYPKRHRVKTFFNPLPDNVTTLPDILKRRGWKTSAWCEHLTFKIQRITKGIDTVVIPFENEGANLFGFIDRLNPQENNFIFLHFFDVHKPYFYTTGGTERHAYNKSYMEEMEMISEKVGGDFQSLLLNAQTEARRVVDNYDNLNASLKEYATYRSLDYLLREGLRTKNMLFEEIVPLYVRGVNKFDQGKFRDIVNKLTENGFLENSLLIIVSDHGETRCKWNGRKDFMNSYNALEGAIHVPLVIYYESLPKELETKAEVSLIDLVPTILNLLNLKVDLNLDGISLKPLIKIKGGEHEPLERTLFSESWAYQGKSTFFGSADKSLKEVFLAEACARKKGFKYVWRNKKVGKNGFYNYMKDPFEENDLLPDERALKLKNELLDYMLGYRIEKMKKRINLKKLSKESGNQKI